jgi:hypothetical protein
LPGLWTFTLQNKHAVPNLVSLPEYSAPLTLWRLSQLMHPFFQDIVTFSIKEDMYLSLRERAVVQITYSPNLHYVYALKQVDVGSK